MTPIKQINVLALVILACGLLLSVMMWRYTAHNVAEDQKKDFDYLAIQAEDSLNSRIQVFSEVLAGLQSVFAMEQHLSRAEFRRIVIRNGFLDRDPGITVAGYIQAVPAASKTTFESQVRNDRLLDPVGYPHFAIKPEGDRAEYLVITYLEPMLGNEKAFGLDVGSEPVRREGAERARNTGELAATGGITLVQESGSQKAFLFFAPLYRTGMPIQTVEQRRAAFLGLVYFGLRMGDLVDKSIGERFLNRMDVVIEDAQPDTVAAGAVLFDSRGQHIRSKIGFGSGDHPMRQSLIKVGGRQWRITLTQKGEALSGMGANLPWVVLIGGGTISFLLFWVVSALGSSNRRATALAEEMVQELQDSESRSRIVLDNVLDGIITISEQGIIESFNGSAENIFGYTAVEVIGSNVNMLMPEPYHSQHDDYLHNYTTTGKKKIIGIGREVVGRRNDGSTFPMDLAVSEMRIGDKRMFTGIVRDISQRKQAEETIARTSRLNQEILDSADFSIISTDTQGIILTFNHAAEKMLGYRADELVGKFTPAQFHIADEVLRHAQELTAMGVPVEPGFEAFVALARGGQVDKHEWTYKRKDGSSFPVSLTVTALRDENGAVTGFLGMAQDISEQRKAERMKSEFISTVSHELRTPLTSIRGSLGLIAGGVAGELSPNVKVLVDIAHKNSERLILLVNDILDMEKIESGKIEFQLKPVELMPVLRQALESNRAYGEQYDVSFELESDLPGIMLNVDANRLMQILANLLSNAAKYSPAGDKVMVDVMRIGNRIRVTVKDHGSGIPEQFRDRIFQKFAQADSSDTRKKGGTGLGLSITKAIVEQMGGSIGFNSEPDVLTIFFVEFPVWQEPAVNASGLSGKEKRVLICEDDHDIAALLRLMLEQNGLAADIAYDAMQAKRMLAQGEYVAMTLDLALPDQDGISLIRELRKTKDAASLPIVVVSAKAVEGRQELGGEAISVIDWISKPINQDQLIMALKQVMEQPLDSQPRVLQVEDDPDVFRVVQSIVGEVAHLDHASTLAEARQLLGRYRYDLVILDLGLPDGSGKDLLPLLNGASPPIPVMVFSASEMGLEGVKTVDNALVKARTSNEVLLATIKQLIGVPKNGG